jgi:hypothetical protein
VTPERAQDVTGWLLDSDPSLRWQGMRDLTGASAIEVTAERARVATEGWGARLLALCGADGQWAGGACFPADFRGEFSVGQPWTSTYPPLLLLRDLGINPWQVGWGLSSSSGRTDPLSSTAPSLLPDSVRALRCGLKRRPGA